MNELEYMNFYDKVGKIQGWDFKELQITSEGIGWIFYEEVVKRSKETDVLLDLGTGGGEKIIPISSSFSSVVGIDLSSGMVETAKSNLVQTNVSNVQFKQMSSKDLLFTKDLFDVVSCCHAPFFSKEVAKVLKKGGLFLTQQVSEADKLNIKTAFGRGQEFGVVDGTLKEAYIRELMEAGFSSVDSFEYNALEYYHRPEDLLFLLQHTPIIPYFGHEKKDFQILNDFIENNRTIKGICTNSKRFLIIAVK